MRIRMVAHRRRIEPRRAVDIGSHDLGSVQVGDEAVIVLHLQDQADDCVGVGDVKIRPRVDRPGIRSGLARFHSSRDEIGVVTCRILVTEAKAAARPTLCPRVKAQLVPARVE